jgi:PBSX family phage terminase large subunit
MNQKQIKDELWNRGNLSFKFHSGQQQIDDAFKSVQQMLFVCLCARRYGKTFWGICKAFETAIQKKKSRIIIAAAFQKDVAEFIIPLAQQILEDCPVSLQPKYISNTKKFVFPNKSQVLLVGLDKNPDAGRGQYCDLYLFEESGFISETQFNYIYSSVVMPMTVNRPDSKVIMISTPPKSPSHPFRDFCEKAKLENAFIKLTIHDNPRIDEATKAKYKKECIHESDWLREYECEFAIDEQSAIIPEWNSNKFAKEVEKEKHTNLFHKYVAMDLGFKDFTAILFAYYDFSKAQLIIEDEIVVNKKTLSEISELIKAKEQELWQNTKPYRRISDNDLQAISDLGSTHGVHFMATAKHDLQAAINKVREWTNNERVIVSPKCKHLIGCLETGVWNNQRTEFARSTVYGHFDGLAALTYLIRNIDIYTNPIPKDYGVSYHTHWIPPDTDKSNTEQAIRDIFKLR